MMQNAKKLRAELAPGKNNLQGVWTAVLTPQHPDLSPDYDLLLEHCYLLFSSGSDGVVLLGSTGEANSFSLHERMLMIKTLSKSKLPHEKCIIGTGCCALPDTIELSRLAINKGFYQLLILPPFYYKDVLERGLLAYFDSLLDKIYTPQLKILYYHFPKLTGITPSTEFISILLEHYPHTFAGIKDSSGNSEQMLSISRQFPVLRIFAGSEEFLLDILKAGAAGCISATANISCSFAAELYKKWREPEAVLIQKKVTAIRKAITRFPLIPALKVILAVKQNDNRWLNLRPPHVLLTQQEQQILIASMSTLGIF